MIFLGCDPGASGSIALFNDLDLIDVFDIPFRNIGGNKIMDIVALEDILSKVTNIDEIEKAYIEQVGSRTGQGVKSTFSFGGRFGEVNAWCLTLTENMVFLSPQKWKSMAGLIGMGKEQSAIKAAKVFPSKAEKFVQNNKRCKSGIKYFDGRGDAVLIGLMGIKGDRK